jgi:tetratricopeptide (TPR) repeat protein
MRIFRFNPVVAPIPGPGPVKVRDPKAGSTKWVLLGALVVGVLLWRPLGLGESFNAMRQDFVAMRYFKHAIQTLQRKPVDRSAAVAMVDRALELAPENRLMADQAGLIYLYAQAYEKAAQHLNRLPQRDLSGDIHLSHCLLLSGQREAGIQLLQSAYEQVGVATPPDATGRYRRAVYLNEIGYSYAVSGFEADRAVDLLHEAVHLQPLEPAFIDSLGWAYYQTGQHPQAMFYLERAVRLAGMRNNHETYYHLGAVYARMGYTRRAAKALNKALEYDPHYEPAAEELRRLGWELPQPMRV